MHQHNTQRKWIKSLGVPLLLIAGGTSISAYALLTEYTPWIASSRHARKVNPVEVNPASIAAGAKVYAAECVACHGKTGLGDGIRAAELDPRPGNLSSPDIWIQSDGELYYKINKGRKPMPGFNKLLTSEQIWQVTNYTRTLAIKPTVFGPRFDIGQEPRDAIGKIVRIVSTMFTSPTCTDTKAMASSIDDLVLVVDALASVKLKDQDKTITRLWSKLASSLATKTHALDSSSDDKSRSVAISKFSNSLAAMLGLFGGVETGRLYQFAIPAGDQSDDLLTWFQKEAIPHSPFNNSDSSKPTIISIFGPKTSTE